MILNIRKKLSMKWWWFTKGWLLTSSSHCSQKNVGFKVRHHLLGSEAVKLELLLVYMEKSWPQSIYTLLFVCWAAEMKVPCDAVVCLMRHFLELSHMQRGIWDGSSIVCVTLAAGFTGSQKMRELGAASSPKRFESLFSLAAARLKAANRTARKWTIY